MILQLLLAAALWQQPSVDQVLANVRIAVGYDAVVASRGFEMTGSANQYSVEAEFKFVFEPSGRYVHSFVGVLGQTRGWDGKQGWERDFNGATMPLHMSELAFQHSVSWTIGHRWLDPEGPFAVSLAETEPGGDSYTLNLKQRDGPHSSTIVVDLKSWLPKSMSYETDDITFALEFSNWERTAGVSLPRRIETSEGPIKGWVEIEDVRPMPVYERSPFEMPAWSVERDTKYDSAKQGAVETKRARTGHIMVKPTIQGEDVGWFILDSGAGAMVVDSAVAKRLGGTPFGAVNISGIGGVLQSGFYSFEEFRLGPVTVDHLTFIDLDLSRIGRMFGVEIGGIVGYDFFRRATVVIDVVTGELEVYDPRSFELERGEWQRLVLDGRHPTIEAKFEGGRTGRFRIDTGAPGSVIFNAPAVLQFGLLEGRETGRAQIGGVGGSLTARSGRIEWFEMGGHRWNDLSVIFAVEDEGVMGGAFLTGNLGQDLLEPFTLVLDYANVRLALVEKD